MAEEKTCCCLDTQKRKGQCLKGRQLTSKHHLGCKRRGDEMPVQPQPAGTSVPIAALRAAEEQQRLGREDALQT